MGEFITATAFQTEDLDAVREAVLGFFTTNSWAAENVDEQSPPTENDVRVYSPTGGWTVILWPTPFSELAAAEFVSRRLGTLASSVSLYDGDYWRHMLLRNGVTLDRFASLPDYFAESRQDADRLRRKYASRPATVADAVGIPVEQVTPYLTPVKLDDIEDLDIERGTAFPDDEFELDDPWVFVDFWRHFGPHYPQDPAAARLIIRLAPGWLEKLPYGDGEL
ncbi:hypothetical protein GCM10010435_45970 [Winogradskya consettensis]|uniref:Uncharacterized protein n=1 Tax=Winogradskya consettensis TaxID=113560 RepID=A0A919W172_9ACTN|nr:hypothetical protein [Actinoplanes consettensis]GIM82992.1 hypothetical protein Aco04nite_84360 [Actinoplanes consettensis]